MVVVVMELGRDEIGGERGDEVALVVKMASLGRPRRRSPE